MMPGPVRRAYRLSASVPRSLTPHLSAVRPLVAQALLRRSWHFLVKSSDRGTYYEARRPAPRLFVRVCDSVGPGNLCIIESMNG